MKAVDLAAGLALTLLGMSGIATAKTAPTVYDMKYSGTVTSGVDVDDLFGGGNLAGDAFSEVFDVVAADAVSGPGGLVAAGPGRYAPILSATLTIDGKSVSLTPSAVTSNVARPQASDHSFGSATLVDTRSTGLLYDFASDQACAGHQGCMTYTLTGGVTDLTSGSAFPANLNNDWNIRVGKGVENADSFFSVSGGPCGSNELLHLGVTSAAPEPSAWALLMLGRARKAPGHGFREAWAA